jgi:hypothetical protein
MKIFAVVSGLILMLFVVGLFISLPVMLLWNWLMPEIFHLPEINWLQAWGLSLLSGFLFKSDSHTPKSE